MERVDDEHLDWFEQRARDRLERVLGSLRVIDRKGKGNPPRQHDMEADLPTGTIAAIEVTSVVDQRRLDLTASAGRHLSTVRVSGSDYSWQVGLSPNAKVNAISPAGLIGLLNDLEQQGIFAIVADYGGPFSARLWELGIQSVYGWKANPGSGGAVKVGAGFYSGREWGRAAIDAWLDNFFRSSRAENKLSKLASASHAIERHLAIVFDPFSQAGTGISLALLTWHEEGKAGDVMPSYVPPDPLTHMWLMPLFGATEAFYWTHRSEWAVRSFGKLDNPEPNG
jgi:hypothetical protein